MTFFKIDISGIYSKALKLRNISGYGTKDLKIFLV